MERRGGWRGRKVEERREQGKRGEERDRERDREREERERGER